MLSFFGEYLSPTNPIAFYIITCLIVFFLGWLIGLLTYWCRLWVERKQIENNQNIQPLVAARQKRDQGREDNNQKDDPENAFSEFFNESGLNRRSPIANHLKAIFLAGWDETRLEVGELINHTTAGLFKWNNLFRSMLAVFIVIGLLGTLFGLTDSLTRLAPVLKERVANQTSMENGDLEESTANAAATKNNGEMTKALSDLFNDIKGAFAPSILGIIFTILGVILYGFYLQIACHPVKSILERLTLTVWVPQLYPTTSQKLIQTLHESEAHMRKGYQTAVQVGELVGTVQTNIDGFKQTLTQTRAITQPLSTSAGHINKAASDISTAAAVLNTGFTESLDKFSKEFTSSVTHLTGFQDEIRNLHQEFQKVSNEKLDQQTQKLEEQNQNLATTLGVLKDYEKLYVDSCQEIEKTLQEFLNKTSETRANIETTNREFLEGINATNREWIQEIQTQLKTELAIIQPTLKEELNGLTRQLTSNLKAVQTALDEGLEALTDQLRVFQLPIEKAANQIERIIESFTQIMEEVVNDLKSEFQKQNEKIEEQYEKYEEQLTEVRSLNESVVNLLNQLDENSKNQKDAVDALGLNVSGLTENTKHLAAVITSFTSDSGILSQSIAAIEEHTETLGTASQQFAEKVEKADVTPLITNIERLNTAVNEISQNSRALTDAINTLTGQIDTSGESPLIQEKFSFLKRIWILFLGRLAGKQTSEKKQSKKKQK